MKRARTKKQISKRFAGVFLALLLCVASLHPTLAAEILPEDPAAVAESNAASKGSSAANTGEPAEGETDALAETAPPAGSKAEEGEDPKEDPTEQPEETPTEEFTESPAGTPTEQPAEAAAEQPAETGEMQAPPAVDLPAAETVKSSASVSVQEKAPVPQETSKQTQTAEEAPAPKTEKKSAPKTGAAAKAAVIKEGYYYLQSALSAEHVLEVAGDSKEMRVNVQLGKKANKFSQLFYVRSLGNGIYTLQNQNSGHMLDVQGGNKAVGANVWQYKANNTPAQKWKIVEETDGTLSVTAVLSGHMMAVAGGTAAAGVNVNLAKTGTGKALRWNLLAPDAAFAREAALVEADLKTGYYSLLAGRNETLAVTVENGSRQTKANVLLKKRSDSAFQTFYVKALGDGIYTITALHSSQAVELAGGRTVNRTNIQQYTQNGTEAQKWRIKKDPQSGQFVIESAKSPRKVLELAGGIVETDTNIQLFSFNAGRGQFWEFNALKLTRKKDSQIDLADGIYTIASAGNASFVFDVELGNIFDGANIRLYRGNGTNAQKFSIQKNADGSCAILGLASGRALAVSGKRQKGANLYQSQAAAAANKKWTLLGTGDPDGSVYLQTADGFCADVTLGKIGNKQNLQLYTKNRTKAQKFLILPASPASTGFRTVSGKTYYYQNGKAATGWKTLSGKDFYFDKSGVMVKNKAVGGKMLGADGYVVGARGIFLQPITGQKTLTSYLINAMVPAGRTLYIWGGGHHDGEIQGKVKDSMVIGFMPSWERFYKAHANPGYNYNQHRYSYGDGLDCSGYTGWVLYNTLYTKEDMEWTAWVASETAPKYISKGWAGSTKGKAFKPGDVVSMNGHVWISLGKVADGGTLLVHASPNGVQISGTTSGAVALAGKYMKKLNPAWPYEIRLVAGYTATVTEKATWKTGKEGLLSDPDGLQKMTAEQLMKFLFNE